MDSTSRYVWLLGPRNARFSILTSASLEGYVRKTRESQKVYVGASPRTTSKLLMASKACALVHGRNYVIPEDISYISKYLLNHRLILRPEAMLDESDIGTDVAFKVIEEILSEVPAP